RLWDTATGEPLSPYLRHPDPILWAGFSPDGRTILTASRDRTLRFWDVPANQPLGPSLPHSKPVIDLSLADEDVILTQAYDSTQAGNGTAEVRFWSAATRQPLGPPLQWAPNVYWWLSPDGRTVLTGRPRLDTSVQRWDVVTGRPRGEPLPLEGGIEWVA